MRPTLLAVGLIIGSVPGLHAQAPARQALEAPSSAQVIADERALASEMAIASRVEIVRTEYGVPHIYAEDLEAMGFALGWVQSEDYGDATAFAMAQRRGTLARFLGRDALESDFAALPAHQHAVSMYPTLDSRTRAVYEGFAAGVNHYVRLNRDVFPEWIVPDFTGPDALAGDVYTWSRGDAAAFVRAENARQDVGDRAPEDGVLDRTPDAAAPFDASLGADPLLPTDFDPERDGSNAWALDGSRTTSGDAILLRNPHLSWNAGYYEAHVRVPGVIDFYGDFRISMAFGIIGGFNRHLGWATTNNSPRYSQVYAFDRDPNRDDAYILDGRSVDLRSEAVTVEFLSDRGNLVPSTRTTLWSDHGPVIHETGDHVFVLKDPRLDEYRRGDQFVRMMTAETLDEWLDAMRMRAHASSNFTYADADGNVALYYNARIPNLPHESTGSEAAFVSSSEEVWSELAPWESLPLYINPPGGYVQQANDTPDYINLNVVLDRDTVAPNLPTPRLRMRSQLSFDLIHNDDVLSLEDVVERKHSPRMLAAERMLDDLLAAVDAQEPSPALERARRVLASWDRTAAKESRGGVLFRRWFGIYRQVADSMTYRTPWTEDDPVRTPRGIGAPGKAVAALRLAVERMDEAGTAIDVRWGDYNRVIRGNVDAPVAGCEGLLGCFRTLSFAPTEDGRVQVNSGDGWVFAVEFGEIPRAYTVLAYGQSSLEDSPHFDDQAEMFADGEMKRILWTDEEIAAGAIRRYRPGPDATTDGGRR